MSLRSALSSTTRVRHVHLRASTCAITTRTMSSLHSQEHPPAVHLERTSLSSARSLMLTSTGPSPTSGPESNRDVPGELSDQEWEIRTGRAIYVLQQTLPTFFSTGLISSLDTSASNTKEKEDDEISIYSPNIRLEYRPPAPFPPAFPKTLHVEGLPLYLASSAFVRHTLNALYTDLRVELQRVRVHGPRSSSTSGLRPDSDPNQPEETQRSNKTRSIREKSLFIGLRVVGVNRVSKADGGWEVNSTYTFSPVTGLICLHNIDSIQPAPHQAFFSALQAALSKIGLGGPSGAEGVGGVARNSPPPQTQPTHPVARS
ncbi:hypothetical protein C8Q74DRAFT_1282998 [Fomes fomentarius]|nr:hypothetical protein C8Q74DRAFT_1282998 [Fomes fomentarius]